MTTLKISSEIVNKLRLELRRGALPLAVLAQLRREHYGYSLRKELNAKGYFPAYQARPEDCIYCAICCVMCPDVAITIEETAEDTTAS